MEFIKEIFSEHSNEFYEKLTSSGFNSKQASQFLPEAAAGITQAAKQGNTQEMVSGLATGEYSQILSSINIAGMASKLGMSQEQITTGFKSILPMVSKLVVNSGGVTAAISSVAGSSGGGLLGAAKKLFG